MSSRTHILVFFTVVIAAVFGMSGIAYAAGPASPTIDIDINAGDGRGYVTAVKVFLLMSLLSVAPAVLMSVSCFTRIIVVLGLLRHAVGVQQLPPTKVLVGLALFLTLFTMSPVWTAVNVNALTPYEQGTIGGQEAMTRAMKPIRMFMLQHTREEDLSLFLSFSQADQPKVVDELSTFTIIPAFMLSELKTAFQMGAMLFLPFLVIDIIVASVLMSMGMMMLPPIMVSLPVKLFVFVLADGWGLVIESLAESIMLPAGG